MTTPVDPVHGPPNRTGPWTTPNFQKQISPGKMKIRRGSERKTPTYVVHYLLPTVFVIESFPCNDGPVGFSGPLFPHN